MPGVADSSTVTAKAMGPVTPSGTLPTGRVVVSTFRGASPAARVTVTFRAVVTRVSASRVPPVEISPPLSRESSRVVTSPASTWLSDR